MNAVEISEIIRNWAIVVGGAVGLGLAIWRGFSHDRQARAQDRQAAVAQRAHITDVFTVALGLLRDEKLEIRLGAITSLIQIARDYPSFSTPISELLQTYVREKSGDEKEIDPAIDTLKIIAFLSDQLRGDDSDVG
jgi:hypothetical protein